MKTVNFKKITAVNFLSIGDEPVSVEFTKGLHIITGNNLDKPDRRNAIGKSTIADSIYFAIFGETLREIKKDLIPNNVTGGKTHVELDFDVITPASSKSYKIIRTLSPTKVQFFEDNEDKTRDSIANTTKYICDVLSASPSVFQNCVIMTVNNAVPFMAKSKIDKRKFIEDIFGLEVFSEMISSLRSEYNDIKKEHDTYQAKLTEVETSVNNYVIQQTNTLARRKEKKELYESRKENNAKERDTLVEYINNFNTPNTEDLITNLKNYETGIEKCNTYINQYTADIAVYKQRVNDLKEKYQIIGTSEQTCPVCLRAVAEHDLNHIKEEKQKLKDTIEQIVNDIKDVTTRISAVSDKKALIKNKISNIRNEINAANLQNQDINNKQERIKQLNEWLNELDVDIAAVSTTTTDFDDIIESTKTRLNDLIKVCEEHRKNLNKLDIVKYIVSEEGVKSFIVNKLLNILNGSLLNYLQKLDSNSICIFNEYFEEEILNEKNKVCSYFNFSGAERKAIDLACLFTFSDLRRLQGGVKYNIAIYDELFDSSFDEKGIELITTILKERVDTLDECAIIISHRKESIKNITGDVVFLQKENGITRRVEYNE